MARLASPHQRTGAVAGLCTSKVGKRLPEGTQGAAERQRDVADIEAAETPGEGLPSRLAPERGCHEVTGVKKARLRSKRRGPGDMPRTRTPLKGSTSESASADRRGRGTLQCKVGKRLEHRRGSGICPDK